MKPKVLVTRNIPRIGLAKLFEKAEVDYHNSNEKIPTDDLINRIKDVDGILSVGIRVDEELISHAPKLKVISNYGVGYDNVDIKAATRRGIIVTNTPEVVTEATAELAFGLIIAVTRRICEADKLLRYDKNFRWGPMCLPGMELSGKTLGIIGFGRIGKAVARRAKAFNMKVIYYKRNSRSPKQDQKDNCFYASFEEILQKSDIISLHVPLTTDTYHLIGERELNMMKQGAFLINTARGTVIDEKALADALKKGHIAGAGLDVFEYEPKIHPELLKLKNTVLTPHIGTTTIATRIKMAQLASENLLCALEGKQLKNVVNPLSLRTSKNRKR